LGDTPLNVPHIAWFSYQVLWRSVQAFKYY
jgi:hypothetical protein